MAKISEAARLRAIEYQKQNDALRGIPQAENAGIPEAIGQQPAPQSGGPQLETTGFSSLDFLKDVGGVVYNAASDFQHPFIGTGVLIDAFQKGVIGGIGGMVEKGTTSLVVADFKRNYIDGDSPFKNLTYNIYKDMMNKVNAQKVKTPQGGTTLSYGQETTPTATNPGNVSASENQRAIEDSFVNMQMKNRASAGDDTYSHGKDGKNYSMVGGALLDMSDYISKQIDAPEQGYELFRGFGNMASFAVGGMAKAGLSKLGMKTASKYAANMGTGIMIAAETDGYLDGVIKERGVAALGDPIVMSTALGVGVANAIIEKKFGFDPTNLAAKAAMKASIKEGAMDILEKGITRETLGTVGKTASRIVGEAAGTAVSEGTQEVLQSLVGDVTKYGITSLYGKGVVDNPLSDTDTRKLIHGYATDFAIGGMIGGLMNGFQNAVDGKEDRNAAYDYIRNGNSSFNPESAGGYVADKFRDFKDFFHNEDAGNSPADIRRRADKVKAAMANKVQGDWEIIQNNAGITDEQRIQQLDEAKQKYEQGAAAIDNLANLAINIPSRVGQDASFQAYQILEKKKALKELIKADAQLTGDEDIDNAALALNDSDIKAREELMGIYDKQLKEIGKDGATTIDKKEQALLRQVGLSEYAEPLLDKKDSKVEGIVNEGMLLNDETSFVAPNGKTFVKDNGQWVGLEKISEADSIDNVDPVTGVKTKEAIPAKYRVDTKFDATDKQDNIQAAYEASGSAKRVQNDAAAEADRINKEELKKEQDAKIELDKQIKETNDELARIKKEKKEAQDAELKELRIESARLTNEAKRAGIKAKEKAALEKEAKAKNDEAAAIESAEYKKDEREIKYEKLLQDLYNAQDLAVKKIDEVQSRINVNEEKLETQKAITEQVKNGKSKSGNTDKSTFGEALADREFKKFFDTLEPHIMYGLQAQDVPWETVSDISLDENDESGDRASVKIPGFGWANIPFELVGGDKVFKYFIAKGIDEYSEKDLLHFPFKGEVFAVTPEGEVSINRRNPGVRVRVANSSLTPDGKQTDKKSPDLTKREGILKGIKKAFESGSSGSDAVKEAVALIYENYKNGLVAFNIGDVAHIANKIADQGEVWSGELDARFIELFNLGMDLGSPKKEAAFAKLAKEMGMNVGKMVSDIALSTVIDKAQSVRDIVINQAFKDGLLTDVKIRELKNRQLNEKPAIVDGKDRGAEYTGGENSEGTDQEVQSSQPAATETQANGEGAAVAEKPSTETAKSTESGGRDAGTGKTGTTKGAETAKGNDVEDDVEGEVVKTKEFWTSQKSIGEDVDAEIGDTVTFDKKQYVVKGKVMMGKTKESTKYLIEPISAMEENPAAVQEIAPVGEPVNETPADTENYERKKFNGKLSSIEKGDTIEYDGKKWEIISIIGKDIKVLEVGVPGSFATLEPSDIDAVFILPELTVEEENIVEELKMPKNDAKKAKAASTKRSQKSAAVVENIEAKIESGESEGIIEALERAERNLLENVPVDESFENKYGVSEVALANELNSLGKDSDVLGAFKSISEKEIDNEEAFYQDFVAALDKEGIVLKFPMILKDVKINLKGKPTKSPAFKKTGADALSNIVSTDELRPAMTGVFIDGDNMVATDGYAMVVVKKDPSLLDKLKAAFIKANSKLMGLSAATKAAEQFTDVDGKIVNLNKGRIEDGRYPVYQQIIPENDKKSKSYPIQELLDLFYGAAINSKNIFAFPANFTFEGVNMSVNPNLVVKVLNALKANGTNSIQVSASSPKRAITFWGDNGSIGLTMPMVDGLGIGTDIGSFDSISYGDTQKVLSVDDALKAIKDQLSGNLGIAFSPEKEADRIYRLTLAVKDLALALIKEGIATINNVIKEVSKRVKVDKAVLDAAQEQLDVQFSAASVEVPQFAAKGDRYFEYVPIKEVDAYKEFDRETDIKFDKSELDDLTEDIRKNGITTPITIEVYNGKGLIVEGNHRLAAAKRLGIKNIPVRIIERSKDFGSINKNRAVKMPRRMDIGELKVFNPEIELKNIDNSPAKFGFTKVEPTIQKNANTLLAPNGKKSNLTPEQYKQVRTKEFKDWFGDWENDPENSSKVVDENGEPLVVYHSTNEDFSIFDKKKIGKNYTLRHGNGFYFSSGMLGNSQWGNKTESYFLNIKNIAKSTLSLKEEAKNSGFLDDYDNSVDIVSYAKTINIDGFYAGDNFSKEYVAFEPNQIKSATDNNGEFSSGNNDIRFQKTAPAQSDSIEQVKKLAAKMAGKFKGSKIKFFTDKDRNIDGIQLKIGEKVWGIKASDGTIYLNLDGISFEAAIHEFSHLWEAVYPSKFLEGVSILEGTKEGEDLFEELRNNKSYDNLTDNQIWREALNTAIGRKGQDLFKGTKLMRFKEYLKSFFRGVAERVLGGKFTVTPDMKLKDFLNLAVGEITNKGGDYKNKTKKQFMKLPDGRMGEIMSPEVVNGFYSPLEKIILETKFNKLPAKQWLEKFGKGDEAKWTGLADWLNGQGTVSKDEIQKFLKENRIQVIEVVKGSVGNFNTRNGLVPMELESKLDYIASANKSNLTIEQNRKGTWNIHDRTNSPLPILKEISSESEANDIILNTEKYRDSSPTKYSQYQLEGDKSNYKEILVTMPRKLTKDEKRFAELRSKRSLTKEESSEFAELVNNDIDTSYGSENGQFKSSHFEEKNILVHIRMNTRTDSEGNKVLFIEELQSDWGQKGKKEGFAGDKAKELFNQFRYEVMDVGGKKLHTYLSADGETVISSSEKFENAKQTAEDTARRSAEFIYTREVPAAPFITDTNSWVKLGLKVALKEAVKQGADKIAWATGEQQNERYDLSKSVDEIDVYKYVDGSGYRIKGIKDGSTMMEHSDVPENKLEDYIGKELAKKIVDDYSQLGSESGSKTYSGIDLKVGGKGMKGFYGSPSEGSLGIVGSLAKSLFRQTPKTVEIETGVKTVRNWEGAERLGFSVIKKSDYKYASENTNDFVVVGEDGYAVTSANTREEAIGKFLKTSNLADSKQATTSTQYSIDITPELRQQVADGLPLFLAYQFNAAMAFGDGRFESGTEVNLGLDPSRNLVEQLVQTDWSDMLEKDNFDQLFDNFVAPIHEDISGKGNPVWQEILGSEDLRELVRAEIIDESSEKEIVDKVSKIGTKDDTEVGKKIKEVAKQLRDNTFFKSEIPNMSPYVYYDEIENKFYKIDAKKEAALVKKSGVFVGAIARLMGSSKQLDTILLGLQEPGGFLSKIRVMMQGEALDRKDKVKDRLKKKLMALIDKFPELTNQTTERPITFDGVTINLSEAFSLFLQDERVLRETGSRFIGGLKTFQDVKGDTHPLNDYQAFYDALEAGMKKYGKNTLAAAKADFESFFNDSVVRENMRPAMLVTQGITDFKLGVPIIEAADDRPFLMASFSPGTPKAASGKVEGKVLHSLPLNEVMANHMSQVENFIEAAEYTHHVEQWNKKYGKSAYEFKSNPNAGMAQKLKDAVSSKLLKNAFPESLDSRIKNVGGTGKLKTLKFLQFLSNSMSRSQFALNLSSGAIQSLGIVSLAVAPMRRGYGKAIVQFFKKSATSIVPVFEALTNIANNKKYERMTRHDVEDYLNASWLPFKKLGWADTVAEMKKHSPYLYGRLNNSFFEINEILRDSSEIRGNYKNKQAEALNRLGRNLSINQTVGDIGVIIAEWQMSKKEYMNNPITVPYNGSKIVLKGFEAVAFAAKANVQATQVVHDMSQMTNLKMAAQRGDQVAQLISAMFPFITENLKRMNMAAFYAMQKEAPAGFTNTQWQMKRKLAFPTAMAAMAIGYKLLSGLWSSLRFDCGTEKMDEVFDRVLSVPKTGIQTTDLLTNMVGAPPILGQLSYQMKGLDTKTVKKYGDDYEWGEFGKSFHPTDVVADLVTIGYAKKIEKELMDDTRDGSLDAEEYGMWAVEAASALAGIPKTLLAIADCFRR